MTPRPVQNSVLFGMLPAHRVGALARACRMTGLRRLRILSVTTNAAETKDMTRSIAVAALAGLLVFASSAPTAKADIVGTFAKGRTQLSVFGGSGYAFDETYFVIGAGISYYLVNGLNIGISGEAWTGGDPAIYKITPSVQYVFYQVPRVAPYLGAFYTHTDIADRPNLDSVGGRAGVYVSVGGNAHLGVGGVYESYLDCTKAQYNSCSNTYPELSFIVAF
jgi:hypothetical protein